MSIAQIIEISCDADGCEETFTADGCGIGEARRRAKLVGWRFPQRRGSQPTPDLCPQHVHPTHMLPCGHCGEPMEVPVSATIAAHRGPCRLGRTKAAISIGY